MMIRLDEIIDGEIILAVKEPGAAADDLLELDHGIDRTHEDDVADIAGIHAGGELLRGGQNRGDGLFIVLKIAQMLLTQCAVVGGDPLAIIRIRARLELIDEIAHGQRVVLGGAEDDGLFVLVDLIQKQLDPVGLAFLDFDDPVEVSFRVDFAGFDFPFDELCRRRYRHTRRAWC